MSKNNWNLIIGWLVGGGLFMGLFFISNRHATVVGPENNTPTHWYGTPKYDQSRVPHHYDWQKRIWVYDDEIQIDRANGIKRSKSQEDVIDEYMQRKLKGYKEDTYWGEEYEFEDPD